MARERRDRRGRQPGLRQIPWRLHENPYRPIEVVDAEVIERIHNASLTILEEVGMNFLLPEAREILRKAGADVRENEPRVRLDRGLVMEAIKTIPSSFTLHARNPARNVRIGGRSLICSHVSSAPFCSDLARGRHDGNFSDYCDFLRLAQTFNVIQFIGGYPVEPMDIPVPTRHLDAVSAMATLTDKTLYGYAIGYDQIADSLEITRIARQVPREQIEREPSIMTVVNVNSPLMLDRPMLTGIIEMARAGQVTIVTPFTLSGAMAPATVAGALTQQNAEALAGLALSQLVRPGAPVVYGGFTSNVDMKTGSPAFGTPEYTQAAMVTGQLCRRYGVPFRTSNVNASNAVDAQAAYESMMALWGAVMGGGNIIKHGCGWLEGGLVASFEKLVIDVECVQMMYEFMRPFTADDNAIGLDAVREVGPGGHYFGAAHTLERYENAFYTPLVSDWQNFENWRDRGAQDATQRAHAIYKAALDAYTPPPMEQGVAEELAAFVARRKEEGGARDAA